MIRLVNLITSMWRRKIEYVSVSQHARCIDNGAAGST